MCISYQSFAHSSLAPACAPEPFAIMVMWNSDCINTAKKFRMESGLSGMGHLHFQVWPPYP